MDQRSPPRRSRPLAAYPIVNPFVIASSDRANLPQNESLSDRVTRVRVHRQSQATHTRPPRPVPPPATAPPPHMRDARIDSTRSAGATGPPMTARLWDESGSRPPISTPPDAARPARGRLTGSRSGSRPAYLPGEPGLRDMARNGKTDGKKCRAATRGIRGNRAGSWSVSRPPQTYLAQPTGSRPPRGHRAPPTQQRLPRSRNLERGWEPERVSLSDSDPSPLTPPQPTHPPTQPCTASQPTNAGRRAPPAPAPDRGPAS